jgi:hypothetical protein
MLYDEQGRKLLALSGQKVVVTPEAKKMVVGTVGDPSAALRPDEWNEYAIIARGNHLIHQINGRTTVEVFDHDPAGRAMSGLLAAC